MLHATNIVAYRLHQRRLVQRDAFRQRAQLDRQTQRQRHQPGFHRLQPRLDLPHQLGLAFSHRRRLQGVDRHRLHQRNIVGNGTDQTTLHQAHRFDKGLHGRTLPGC